MALHPANQVGPYSEGAKMRLSRNCENAVIEAGNPSPESSLRAGPGHGGLARLAQDLGTARDLLSVFRALRAYCEELTGSSLLFVSLPMLRPHPLTFLPMAASDGAFTPGPRAKRSTLPHCRRSI